MILRIGGQLSCRGGIHRPACHQGYINFLIPRWLVPTWPGVREDRQGTATASGAFLVIPLALLLLRTRLLRPKTMIIQEPDLDL